MAESPTDAVRQLVRRDPRQFGVARTRWTLATLRAQCPWLQLQSDAGLWRALRRAGLRLKRGRDWVHSPDPAYGTKRDLITTLLAAVGTDPALRLLYLDEVGIYRQPTLSTAYAGVGHTQPLARRSLQANTSTRVLATLDHHSGRVVAYRGSQITIPRLVEFYQNLVAAYPAARELYVVQDNWPVHHHPDLLAALAPQRFPNTVPLPPTWPTTPSPAAVRRWGTLQLPVQLVWLPTYASWLNPIEKLWRKLRQEVTHLHPWADHLPELRDHLDQFLAQFSDGSPDLLRYVGLALPK